MSFDQTTNSYSLLIVQVEPPQREDGGDYYYRTIAPGLAMAEEEGIYVINLTNVHRKKEEIMRQADVLILKNICDPDILPLIRERKEQNKLTVYEQTIFVQFLPGIRSIFSIRTMKISFFSKDRPATATRCSSAYLNFKDCTII